MPHAFAEIPSTPRIRDGQGRFGSAETCARPPSPRRDGGAALGAREAAILSAGDGVSLATAPEAERHYAPFGGGEAGFRDGVDQRTIRFADRPENRRDIGVGDPRHDDRAPIIAHDHARRERPRSWGHARIADAERGKETAHLRDRIARLEPERAGRTAVQGDVIA